MKKRDLIVFIFSIHLLFLWNVSQAQSVIDVLKNNQRTSQFAAAIERAGLNDRLSDKSTSFTIFAPSNQAFSRLSGNEQNSNQLLLNHVITGSATQRSLQYMKKVTCLSGITINIVEENGGLQIQDHPVIESNLRADNGVVHIIDGIIK